MACQLFYWGKACFIFPVCATNMYVLSPYIEDPLSRQIEERFSDRFPGEDLVDLLSTFSQPNSVQHLSVINKETHVSILVLKFLVIKETKKM